MRARLGAILIPLAPIALFVLACGQATPVTPTAATARVPTVAPVSFTAGTYTLGITPGSLTNGRFTYGLCMSVNSAPESANIPISIASTDAGYVGQSVQGTLTLSLSVTSSGVTGVVRGTGVGSNGVTVTFGDGQDVALTGSSSSNGVLTGLVNGNVVLSSTTGSATCAAWAWTMTKQ